MTTTSPAMTSGELHERLRRHYLKPGDLPGGVLVEECGWNGGAQASRCDALFVGFTSASGRLLVGHEVKVSRADWRRELDKVGKADPWADECHAFYVVAPSVEVVPVEELPPEWGLLTVNPRTRTRLDVTKRAAVHADRVPSWRAVRSIFARLDTLRAQEIAAARQAAEREAYGKVEERAAELARRAAGRRDHAAEELAAVEEALGAKVVAGRAWNPSTVSLDTLRALRPLLGDLEALVKLRDRCESTIDVLGPARHLLDDLTTALDTLRSKTVELAEPAS